MKDFVYCSLYVNIPVQSNAAKRRSFDRGVEAIDSYCPVQTPTPTKLVFLWLAQLSLLVSLFIDPNCTQSKNLSENCGKSNDNMSNGVGKRTL